MSMSWPNRITVARLLLVTPFILLLLNARESWAYRYGALAMALVLGIGDAVDGIVARRTGSVTRIGSLLDPLADYALMISALVTLSIPGVLSDDPSLRLPYWVSVTLVSRAIFLLMGTVVVFLLAGFFQGLPSATGKAATVMQFVTVLVMCAAPDVVGLAPAAAPWVLNGLWGVTVALGVISWLGYVRMGSKLLAAGGHTK
ncbi:MAG: CDP-alcohol phosphatidyltransferase family protein [Planctomycetes bacterium]|nr:CDP-alcohol phosphatidyltransferase family protein [Planctomycetota bacterium]